MPHQLGGWGSAEFPWVCGKAPTAQRFPLFSALKIASPDTVILLQPVNHKKKKKNSYPIQSRVKINVHLVKLYVFSI